MEGRQRKGKMIRKAVELRRGGGGYAGTDDVIDDFEAVVLEVALQGEMSGRLWNDNRKDARFRHGERRRCEVPERGNRRTLRRSRRRSG